MAYGIKPITAEEIRKAVGGELYFGNENTVVSSISTDSRNIDKNCLYLPIVGDNFDGHEFIDSVKDLGAVGYICSDGKIRDGFEFAIGVSDTKKALLNIASYYRNLFDVKVIGLTGSVGKTTTKELMWSTLSEKYSVLKTQGNFNNEIGLPLTLFGLNDTHDIAITEMGMSNFGEIENLTNCANPDIAVITNIGVSHIEFLGSREGILRAKCEIFDGLSDDGVAFLNGDDDLLYSLKGKYPFKIIYYGIVNAACDVKADNIIVGLGGVSFNVGSEAYFINLVGKHNVYNALCSICVGRHFDLTYDEIKKGLKNYVTDGIRQNIFVSCGKTIINDCYNASPQSVKAAIDVLKAVGSGKRKIAVLGDMAELGENAPKYHKDVGSYAADAGVDVLILIGEYASHTAHGSEGKCTAAVFDSVADAIKYMDEFFVSDDVILIKGSRKMALEKVAEHIKAQEKKNQ